MNPRLVPANGGWHLAILPLLHEFDAGHTLPPEHSQEAQRWIAATEKAAR